MDALRRPLVPILLGLIAVLLAVLAGLLWRDPPPSAAVAPASQPAMSLPPPVLAPEPRLPPSELPSGPAPAPWSADHGSLPSTQAFEQRSERLEQQRRLTELQIRLQRLAAQGQTVDAGEVARAIEELEAIEGPVVGGVDLRLLRRNLEVADRMKAIAAELQQPVDTNDPASVARMQERLKELQALQSQLVSDVQSGGAPAPAERAR